MRLTAEELNLAVMEATTYVEFANPTKIDPFIARVCKALLDARDYTSKFVAIVSPEG